MRQPHPRITCFIFIIVLLLIGVALAARAETITVGPLTVQAAVKVAKPGDILVCEPSLTPYPGIRISSISGTADERITLSAQTPGTVTFSGMAVGARAVIELQGSNYWNLVGLRFTGGQAGLYLGSSNFVTVERCEAFDNTIQGMQTGSSRGLVFDRVTCRGSKQQHGLYIAGGANANDCVVRRSWFYENARAGVQANSQGQATPISNLLVEDSSFWRNGQAFQAAALNMIGVVNSRFLRLRVYENKAGGISFSGFAASGVKPYQISTGNLVSACNVLFNGGEGRTCVQVSDPAGVPPGSHSSNSVVGCAVQVGKANNQPIAAVNGAIILTDAVTVLPVATTAPVPGPEV